MTEGAKSKTYRSSHNRQAGIIRRNEPMAPLCFPSCLGLVLELPKSATVPQTGLQPAGRSDGLFELQLVRERSRAPKFGA
jgi:hypothetical protein